MLVHGDNIRQKEADATKSTDERDERNRQYLTQIRSKYDEWKAANKELVGPGAVPSEDDTDNRTLSKRVSLFEEYKDFIDQQHYAEHFDSRSNLHSSVLEEFMYYLFRDLLRDFGDNVLVGKSHAFKDLFFMPPNYPAMLKRPYARVERKDHDFVIGVTIEATMRSITQSTSQEAPGEDVTIEAEKPTSYDEVGVTDDSETHKFDIPAVVIECKTYLDKTMLEGSSRAAEDLKARNPNSLYILVMEYIKLTEAVNLYKYKLDQIFILRHQKNTDRKKRYNIGWVKNPVDPVVVQSLYKMVRNHLTIDWERNLTEGIRRGWLL